MPGRLSIGILLAGLASFVVSGCGPSAERLAEHEALVASWRADRDAGLREPDSWLTLVGLEWLEQGANSFGADSSNRIVFPPKAPARIGTFFLDGDSVRVELLPGIGVTIDGQPLLSHGLAPDNRGGPTTMSYDSIIWYVIERRGAYGVRIKDTLSQARTEFPGIEEYPTAYSWRINGKFEPYSPPKMIIVPNILGTVAESPSAGAIVFKKRGRRHRLDVVGEPGDKRYFVIFADETNGDETYGGGRFVYVDAEDEDNDIVIDFNLSYNPPCVFSPYATCPLPPKQNRLALRVEAGELMFGDLQFH